MLVRLGMSFKKGKKLLSKASPSERAAWLPKLEALELRSVLNHNVHLVFIDEAHVHCDCDLGHGWAPRGQRLRVASRSPRLDERQTFYGLYLSNGHEVAILPKPRGNADHTIEVLMALRDWIPEGELHVVWDGVICHRCAAVVAAAKKLKITLHRLPAYSPDFMPVEALWRWMRDEVTRNCCHANVDELRQWVRAFEERANEDPAALYRQLELRRTLDPAIEKLRRSIE